MIILKILLYLLLSLFAILFLIALLKVNIIIAYDESLTANLRVLFVKVPLYPAKEKAKKEKAPKKKKAKTQSSAKNTKEPPKEKKDPLSAVLKIYELVRELTVRFFGYLKVKVCTLSLVAGGKDAAAAATNYGLLLAAANGFAALAENTKNITVCEKEFSCTVDYSSEKISAKVKIVLSIFVFQLIICLIRVCLIYLKQITSKSED